MSLSAEEPYKKMWSNNISIMDLHILHALDAGVSKSTLDKYFEGKGLKIARSRAEKRIEELKKQGIILKENAVIVDPTKLFDYVFLTFIKIHLPFFFPREKIEWGKAYNDLINLNTKYNMLAMAFTVEGTGEYDLALLIYTNSIENYYKFFTELATTTGWVEKVDGKRVHAAKEAGFFFNPIILPDVERYRESVNQYRNMLDRMVREESGALKE